MPKSIYIQNTDLTRDKRFSYLSEDVIQGGSTFRVQSILGFQSLGTSSGQIVLIGDIGNEKSEIIRTSSTSAMSPTYNEVPLQTNMLFDHPQDTKVYIIDWNRADIQWSATTGGVKSTISAYPANIQPDLLETIYVDSMQSSGYYFVRFNETIGNTNSDWSDPIPFSGYDDNTVFMVKKRALDSLGEVIDGKNITHELLNEWLWEARREYHQAPGKRPFRYKFNNKLGTALTGSFRIQLPTTVERPYTGENIFGVRIGSGPNMQYYDKKVFDNDYINVPHNYLVVAHSVGDTDLYLNDVDDFDASGSVTIEKDTISYSAKGVSGGTLRISTDGTSSHASGSDVWQRAIYSLPSYFTVWADLGSSDFANPQQSAYIYFNNVIDSTYNNLNIYSDFYSTLPGYDSDADVLDEPSYDMYTHYLMAKIKHRMNRGADDITKDPDYILWQLKKSQALAKEYIGQVVRIRPDIMNLPLS